MEVSTNKNVISYLTFTIGEEEFAAHVNVVLNILEVQEITKVPKAPEYLKGVINLRGMVLPVIDTRVKLGMTPTQFSDKTCIVVMDLDIKDEIIHVGALVDSVEAVHDIHEESIAPPPSIGNSYKTEFISGITQINDRFIMILDLVKLFTASEIKQLKVNKN